MYKVSKKEWSKIERNHPDYVSKCMKRHEFNGKVCEAGEACCFEYLLPGAPNTGATLVFQHIHFEII